MNFFTKTKFLVAVIIVLSAIILAIFSTMGYHYYRFKRVPNDRPENMQMAKYVAKQLKLTPEQVAQFDSLRERFHAESSALMRDSRNISKEIMEEITSENPDVSKLKAQAEKFGKLQEQQKQIMINHLLEVRGKCDASQLMHFKKFVHQMENHERMNRERNRNTEGRKRD